jgi:hypothetical protein
MLKRALASHTNFSSGTRQATIVTLAKEKDGDLSIELEPTPTNARSQTTRALRAETKLSGLRGASRSGSGRLNRTGFAGGSKR